MLQCTYLGLKHSRRRIWSDRSHINLWPICDRWPYLWVKNLRNVRGKVAGVTGREPAASGVTGQWLMAVFCDTSNFFTYIYRHLPTMTYIKSWKSLARCADYKTTKTNCIKCSAKLAMSMSRKLCCNILKRHTQGTNSDFILIELGIDEFWDW